MALGTIKTILNGFGFIKQDIGNEDVYFKVNWIKKAPSSGIVIGMRVEYETQRTSKGLQTRWIRVIMQDKNRSSGKTQQIREDVQSAQSQDRFLNPYNFIRLLAQPRPKDNVLGDCPPPPHDRYVGLTGQITCEIEAKTPLFISDSQELPEKHKKHREFRFFMVDNEKGEPQESLPATSLRGMVRSVHEAITNSCFGVFDGHRLSWRDKDVAVSLVPARVIEKTVQIEEAKAIKKLFLDLLPGTTSGVGEPRRNEPLRAAWLHKFWPIKPSKTITSGERNYKPWYANKLKHGMVNTKGFQHGSECYALIQQESHPHPRIRYWRVLKIASDPSAFEATNQDQRVERGYLCLNNQNIENKHSERFFFRERESTLPEYLPLTEKVQDDYEQLMRGYQERHKRALLKRKELGQKPDDALGEGDVAFSRFIYEPDANQLKPGDLVYARIQHISSSEYEIEYIVPVLVPRIWYKKSLDDLLNQESFRHIQHCKTYDALCPACRLFGWAHEQATKEDREKRIAYAGRVRFSNASLKHKAGTLDESEEGITLAILATPNPTTTQFYLLDSDGKPNRSIDYNTHNVRLRGRKFYRHHGVEPSSYDSGNYEYERVPDKNGETKGDQNRTVHGVLKEGSKFTFSVYFENLAEVELGALIWSLELDTGMHHRLGYGKPLGFGSVKVTVTQLDLIEPRQRYASPAQDKRQKVMPKEMWSHLVDTFKHDLAAQYGNGRSFDQLPNVSDLRVLSMTPSIRRIHYPRLDKKPQSEGENFRWFVMNQKKVTASTLDRVDTDGGLPYEP